MSDVRRRREIGYVITFTKGGNYVVFRNENYSDLMEAWKAGRAFFDGFGFHGEPQTIKLGDVIYVRLDTADTITAGREEDRADAADDARNEMLNP